MIAVLTATRPAPATSRTTRLAMAREAAKAAGWTARVAPLVLDETSDAARCEDCAHLPGCFCPHDCSPRGI